GCVLEVRSVQHAPTRGILLQSADVCFKRGENQMQVAEELVREDRHHPALRLDDDVLIGTEVRVHSPESARRGYRPRIEPRAQLRSALVEQSNLLGVLIEKRCDDLTKRCIIADGCDEFTLNQSGINRIELTSPLCMHFRRRGNQPHDGKQGEPPVPKSAKSPHHPDSIARWMPARQSSFTGNAGGM